jgi:uncharacterized protein (DUF58 family)
LERDLVLTNPRRIYILPTRFGVGFAVLVGGMLIGSLNYNNNLGFLLSFLLVGLGLVAMLRTWRNLYGLSIRAERAESTFAGHNAGFPLRLTGRDRVAIELESEDSEGSVTLDLDGAPEGRTARLVLPATRRGVLFLGRVKVSTRYPLGLFRAWAYAQPASWVLVYPRPAAAPRRADVPHYRRSEQGDRGVGTDDFVGLRGYHPGDSPRHIDWKALARERGLLSKQFGGDRTDLLWVDWDAWPGVAVEQRLSRLCRGVLDADSSLVDYGLRLPGLTIPPARGAAHRQTCLTALARFEA